MSEEIQIVKFSVEDMLAIDPNLSDVARLNQIAGPCYTAVQGKKVLGCGGVRVDGVGEAWALYSDKAREMKLSLLKETRAWLEIIIRNNALQRIWSECPELRNERFIKCKQLNFRKLEAYLRG